MGEVEERYGLDSFWIFENPRGMTEGRSGCGCNHVYYRKDGKPTMLGPGKAYATFLKQEDVDLTDQVEALFKLREVISGIRNDDGDVPPELKEFLQRVADKHEAKMKKSD